MNVARTIREARQEVAAARAAGRLIGFVPTMGALHAGHISLIDAARRECGHVVVSLFVNPTQFGPNEDFSRYPRDEAGDFGACTRAGVDLVFAPPVAEMYPPSSAAHAPAGSPAADFTARGGLTSIHVARLGDTLCGPHRPGHFDGVATVVAKLLNIVLPDRAYFGQKDAQQLAIVRRMIADLDIPCEIVGCPIVREADGLALSSRNRYLSPDERARALALSRALAAAKAAFDAGQRDAAALTRAMHEIVSAAQPRRIDYVSIVDAQTLQPIERIDRPALAALAVWFGHTRLIDNMTLCP